MPGLPQIVKAAGAEFLLLDMEHNGTTTTIKRQARSAADRSGPNGLVPTNQYHYISRTLDAGCMGVMVPMVGSAEEAKFIVSCTRYPPGGRRGAAFGFAHDDYLSAASPKRSHRARAHAGHVPDRDRARHSNIDKIAAVAGVDVLWLGHFDLTNFLGIPAQFDHPKYVAAIEKLVAAARKHGKVLACMTADDALEQAVLGQGLPAVRRRGRCASASRRDSQRA